MKILIMSNSFGCCYETRYSYGIIAYEIAKALKGAGHEIFYLGMNELHQPYIDKNGIVRLGIRFDPWCSDCLEMYLRMYKADCLLTVFDIWMRFISYLPEVVKKLNIPWITHITINSEPLSPFLKKRLEYANVIIAPSEFNLKVLKEAGLSYKSFYIKHGINIDKFKPNSLFKEEMKRRLKIEDKEFVVVNVSRNKGTQKLHSVLFEGWKILLETYPELKEKGILICLTDPVEDQGERLLEQRNVLGMDKYIMFTFMRPTRDLGSIEITYEGDTNGTYHTANCGFSEEEMIKFYNVADVNVISSAGESFGLPIIEAGSCSIPTIMPASTTAFELIEKPNAGLLFNLDTRILTSIASFVSYGSASSLAENLAILYKDKELRKSLGNNALEFSKNFSWEKILPQWIEIFKKIEEGLTTTDYINKRMGI